MRYVCAPHAYSKETIELAESLFERAVGRRIAADDVDETVAVHNNYGRLSHKPVVMIKSIKAICETHEFSAWMGATDWIDVAIDDVTEWEGVIVLPPSLYGASYSKAHVTYVTGLKEIPVEIQNAVLELARLITDGTLDEWSGFSTLSDEAQAVIRKYRGGE